MTNKNFQISVIKRNLEKSGIPADLIDVSAYVDSTLTLSENARIIKEEASSLKQFDHSIDHNRATQSEKKMERFLEPVKLFEARSNKQKEMDFKRRARKTFQESELNKSNFNKWAKNPNRYDIEGVDSGY